MAIVIVFWLKWAGYLSVEGLNLLAQISDRISPDWESTKGRNLATVPVQRILETVFYKVRIVLRPVR